MSALTSLLVRDGIVPVRRIEDAIQRQVISGGDVETVLLEINALQENALSAYCAALHDLSAATRDEVMNPPAELLGAVPSEWAREHLAVPVDRYEGTLVLASPEPLDAAARDALAERSGHAIETRIACRPRVEAALAAHYGHELSPRVARLVRKLDKRDAGELPPVGKPRTGRLEGHAADIPMKATGGIFGDAGGSTRPAAARQPEVGTSQRAEGDQSRRPGGDTARPPGDGTATEGGLSEAEAGPSAARGQAGTSLPRAPSAPSAASSGPAAEPLTATKTRPATGRPAAAQTRLDRGQSAAGEVSGDVQAGAPRARRARASSQSQLQTIRGPLTLASGERLLKRAADRDGMLGVLFSFARQFFDYTALFVVHEDSADGREGYGVGASTDEVARISVPLHEPGVFADARRMFAPQIVRLNTSDTDRGLAKALGRPAAPPAFVMPLAIRRRVVLLLYGDRDGEAFDLGAVMELVRFMPRVSEAFEGLILRRKRAGYHTEQDDRPAVERETFKDAARRMARTAGSGRASQPTRDERNLWGTVEPAADADDEAVDAATKNASASNASSSAAAPPHGIALGTPPGHVRATAPSEAPPDRAPRPSGQPAAAPEHEFEPAEPTTPRQPVRMLPAPTPTSGSRPAGPPHAVLGIPRTAPPPPPSAELTFNGQQWTVAGPRNGETLGRDGKAEAGPAASGEGRHPEGQRAGGHHVEVPRVEARHFEAPTAKARKHTGDHSIDDILSQVPDAPKPDGSYAVDGGPVDIVPRRGMQSAPGATLGGPEPGPRNGGHTPSVIVDMGNAVHVTVERLARASGDQTAENQCIAELEAHGEAALPALVQAFPGPLKFDRHRQAGLPRGRNVSVVARALVSFGDRAVPYLGSLLNSDNADTRYYAALVSSELVHPDLLPPLAERVFDEDVGLRRLTHALLPLYAGFEKHRDVMRAIRRVARIRGKVKERRLHAVDALASMRDVESIPMMIELLDDPDTKLVDHLHRGLTFLTGTNHGRSAKRWAAWYEKNGGRHRIEWLIDGLLHGDETIRHTSGEEVQRLSQEYFGYHARASRKDRERVHRRYAEWWQTEGRQRFLRAH